MAHEVRTDYALLLGSIFLLGAGARAWSFDAKLTRRDGKNGKGDRAGLSGDAMFSSRLRGGDERPWVQDDMRQFVQP
jgi:hypothetical protein